MQNKQNTKAKVIVVAIAILLCLALAVGITGAWYQAQRRATGTVKMDKGIVIDYTGFGKEADGIWIRENETTFRLFSDSDVQPGEKISLNDAGIKANASSVDFYARVKLSYEFYNGETKVNLANPSDLITTSATFFGSDWVKSNDGYHYYATGTDLNKFTSSTPAGFVDLFDSNARFIIEGAGFTGAENGGEGGGFVVDETTSINKIVVYLTLETLQGDADAAAEGWEITAASDVVFADATAKLETSVGKVETTENLNVSVGGAAEVPLSEVVFPYDTPTILEFDSKNVEYVELTYSNGEKETFLELPASEESATKYSQIQLTADSSKGTVTGYTIGVFGDSSEYTGYIFTSNFISDMVDGEGVVSVALPSDEIALSGYFGSATSITIANTQRVRNRDFKLKITYSDIAGFYERLDEAMWKVQYPCVIEGYEDEVLNDINQLMEFFNRYETDEEIMEAFPTSIVFSFECLCETSNIFYGSKKITCLNAMSFVYSDVQDVTLGNNVLSIGAAAFQYCAQLTSITLNNKLTTIKRSAFDSTAIESILIPESVATVEEGIFGECSSLNEVIIDSAALAGYNLKDGVSTGSTSIGNASKVYVKTGLEVGTDISTSFTKQGSSDKAGYDLYTHN